MLGGSIRTGLVGEADMGAALRIDGIGPGGRIAEINILIARRAAAQRQQRLALAPVRDPALRAYCYASDGRVLARYERSTGTPYAGMGELVGMDEDWPEAWLIEVWKQQSCIGRLQRLPSGELVEIEAGWPRRLISPRTFCRSRLGLW